MKEKKLGRDEICFVGNDVNDVACLEFATNSFAVKDAYPEARKSSKWVTKKKGGYGAVREICDIFRKIKKK